MAKRVDDLREAGRNELSATYLKTVKNQLCALFNHVMRLHGLSSNPCRRAESMDSKSAGEMRFWIKDQYLKFSDEIMGKPLSLHAFKTPYWCGVREGLSDVEREDAPIFGCHRGERRAHPCPIGANVIIVRADPSVSRVWNSSDG